MASPWPGYANDPGAGCAEPSAPPQSARGGVGKWTRLAAGREKPRFIISDDVSGKVSLVTDGIFSALHGDSRPRGEEGDLRLLCRSPQSLQRRCAQSPRAAPACRRAPGRSERSWISSSWREAASQSGPGTGRLRCAGRDTGDIGHREGEKDRTLLTRRRNTAEA